MKTAVKIFLTYASISMFSGLLYGFGYGSIVGMNNINFGIFILLWLGPLGIFVSIGMPILIYCIWAGTLKL